MKTCCCVTVLLMFLVGCGTSSRAVRLNTDAAAPIVFRPLASAVPVRVDADEFVAAVAKLGREVRLPARPQNAAQRLLGVDARSGSFEYDGRTRRFSALGSEDALAEVPARFETPLTLDYRRWCARTGRPGDCLHLLEESSSLDGDGRYTLAMALAQGVVLDELLEAFKDLADPHAMVSAVLWTCTTYMLLLSVPEPVSKGVAAVMTATLIAYVGVDTFWGLVVGFKFLMDEADRAMTFSALRVAGERYGKVLARGAARAFAMIALAAIGNTGSGLASQVPRLPGAMRAAVQAETQLGIRLVEVGAVSAVSVSAEGLALTLPPGAVAMSAETRRPRRFSKADRDEAYEKSQDTAGRARCEYCDETLTRESGQSSSYEADHRQPHSKGGPSSAKNLAPSCRACNREKGAKELDSDWVPPKER